MTGHGTTRASALAKAGSDGCILCRAPGAIFHTARTAGFFTAYALCRKHDADAYGRARAEMKLERLAKGDR